MDPDPLVGTSVGRYAVQSLLRTYATDSVYLAHDPDLGRPVVLKIQNLLGGVPIGERLVRNEARILGQLSHPGVHAIHDVGRHADGRWWFVAEHLNGGTLREALSTGTSRTAALLTSLVEAADAVGYVHRRGFAHRNLKPSTIAFDADGRVRVQGFSLSVRVAERHEADVVAFVGSSAHSAPEVLAQRVEEIGPRSDVWSLGALLHEVLTGRRALRPGDVETLVGGGTPEPLPPPSDLRPDAPVALVDVCLRCLAWDPSARYADASEAADAMRGATQRPATRGPRVFVSHSSRDREWVEREIVGFLERHGIPTWYAKADIDSAEQWERTIVRGLESCPWFLLVMSPRSAESEWVRDEVYWAVQKRPGRLLPVLLEPCDPWKFHIRLARLQHLDFGADKAAAQKDLLDRLLDGAG